jgi:hypothetical protein
MVIKVVSIVKNLAFVSLIRCSVPLRDEVGYEVTPQWTPLPLGKFEVLGLKRVEE